MSRYIATNKQCVVRSFFSFFVVLSYDALICYNRYFSYILSRRQGAMDVHKNQAVADYPEESKSLSTNVDTPLICEALHESCDLCIAELPF